MTDLEKLTRIEDRLESLIDAHGLKHILDSIATVCGGKAEHLESNWQDNIAAKAWDRAGFLISAVADRIEV